MVNAFSTRYHEYPRPPPPRCSTPSPLAATSTRDTGGREGCRRIGITAESAGLAIGRSGWRLGGAREFGYCLSRVFTRVDGLLCLWREGPRGSAALALLIVGIDAGLCAESFMLPHCRHAESHVVVLCYLVVMHYTTVYVIVGVAALQCTTLALSSCHGGIITRKACFFGGCLSLPSDNSVD